MNEEEDFEKRLKEVTKPRKAPWEEHLEEVTGPQVDEVHKAERQLKKYGVEQPPLPLINPPEREDEAKQLDSALKEYARAVADARDIIHLCEVHGERCADVERYERDELDAEKELTSALFSLIRCIAKRSSSPKRSGGESESPEVEEEEYEKIRERARLVRAERLI